MSDPNINLMDDLERLGATALGVKRERDELLSALNQLVEERAADAAGRPSRYAWEQAENAIAKALGQ